MLARPADFRQEGFGCLDIRSSRTKKVKGKGSASGAVCDKTRALIRSVAGRPRLGRLVFAAQDADLYLECVHVRKRFGTLYMPENELLCRSLR